MRSLIRFFLLLFVLLPGRLAHAGGQYETVRFTTEAGRNCYFTIYTPQGYSDTVDYPVLYLLHGIHGNQTTWIGQGHVMQVVDSLIATNRIRPLVIVMPLCLLKDTAQALDISSYMHCMRVFMHSTRHGEFETIFPDIDAYVIAHYSVSSARSNRAVAGLSSGGRQAAVLSNLGTFFMAGLFSPVVQKKQLPRADNGTFYWIRCGAKDMFRKRTYRARRYFDEHGIPYNYVPTEGRHNWKTWRKNIVDFLLFAFPC